MDVIAKSHRAAELWTRVLADVHDLMARRGAHPARVVVLVPYAQLMPLARREWARLHPHGFAPRFETSMNWAARLGHLPGPDDISFDMGRDLLTARAWLERAGLGGRAALLAGPLVQAAWQAAGCASALPPGQRAGWAAQARGAIAGPLAVPQLALEAAVARIALEWAAASRYATDTLLEGSALQGLDLLVLCEGLQADSLGHALAALAGERAVRVPLESAGPRGAAALHEADDPSHEAEIAAACVLRHLEAGRAPVALGAVDRVLTRRVRALLGVRGIAVRDETGWKLSTTRAAAQLMAALRACHRQAASDTVLDWLKNLPGAPAGAVLALERRLRREGLREWADVQRGADAAADLVAQVDGWREAMQPARGLLAWQGALRRLLEESQAWPALVDDAAGAQVLEVLGLSDGAQADWSGLPQGGRRLTLAEFVAWADDSLEAATYVPVAPGDEQVVVLPMHQLLARDFTALVLAGCDEVRLPASPEPPGTWTATQRAALGLPSREALTRERAAAWDQALQVPHVDIVWRRTDDSGEPVLASPLVQSLRLAQASPLAADPRAMRDLSWQPVPRPAAQAPSLAVAQLSASAYEDLRRCPYRFFALRQLGLQEAAEIDVDLDKRDFGNWLHAVLRRFHETLADAPEADRAALLDRCADAVTADQQLASGEFLPFHAAWPQVREGYLAWLAGHEEQEGARFASAETAHEMQLGPVRLVGRIDRIDRLPDGSRMVIDYKTEALAASTDRVKMAHEDTQLAFYAALLADDTLRAAYVNVGERGTTRTVEQPAVVEARDALVAGILDDLGRIGAGAKLSALGEGRACEFCAARGLCRKDSWHA